MANKLPVKFYYHTMPGMPQITNQYGDMVNVLDCVLVNGTTPATVESITFADGVVTVTQTAHGFIQDMVIEISGAAEEEYNGEWRVVSVSPNSFTYIPSVSPAVSSATGSLKSRIPPLGYEIAFTGTNKRVYRSLNPLSTRPYLRVDNSLLPNWSASYAVVSRVTAAASMSGIDSFTDGRMPYDPARPNMNESITGTGVTAQNGWCIWIQFMASINTLTSTHAASTFGRDWTIVGDDMMFYFVANPYTSNTNTVNEVGAAHYGFGNYNSYKNADPYDYILLSQELPSPGNAANIYPGTGSGISVGNSNSSSLGMMLPKSSTGIGEYTNFTLHHNSYRGTGTISNRANNIPFPNLSDYSIRFSSRYICDVARNDLRGIIPGQYFINQATPFTHKTVINDVTIDGTTAKRKMLCLRGSNGTDATATSNTLLAYDITGPWR